VSLRARFILIAMGALVPLLALGLLLVARANYSGEALLQSQLGERVEAAAAQLDSRWNDVNSDLLLIGENEPARLALLGPPVGTPDDAAPEFVQRTYAAMTDVEEVIVRDLTGAVRWHLRARNGATGGSVSSPTSSVVSPSITVRIALRDLVNNAPLATLEARLPVAVLVPGISLTESRTGPLLAVMLPDGTLFAPPASNPAIFRSASTSAGGQHWLSVRREVLQPPLALVVAAVVDPYVDPFRRTARSGLVALLVAAAVLTLLVIAATRRITQDLERLAVAAEAVSGGDIDQQIEVRHSDEIARVARAFNTMTESLRDTLSFLAEREALAAVGEFAAELAHEVRNPLTSMRLDLQRLEEGDQHPEATRVIAGRALRQIARLEHVVGGALRVARGARSELRPIELLGVIEAAVRATEAEFAHRGVKLSIDAGAGSAILPQGDHAALEQLFANLLVNAAQALPPGGAVCVTIESGQASACVVVADNGPGMTSEQIEQARSPFYSTKRDGTGLGLAIARRIAALHGGSITLESVPGEGTRVLVYLPWRSESEG
jgi:signal transduction histidine kinase